MEEMTKTIQEVKNVQSEVIKTFNESSILCALFDVKAGQFGKIFEAPSEQAAQRMFVTLLTTNERSDVTDYPQDFSLYSLGAFDNSTGAFDIYKAPYQIMTGLYAKQTALNLMRERLEDVTGKQISNDTSSVGNDGESD